MIRADLTFGGHMERSIISRPNALKLREDEFDGAPTGWKWLSHTLSKPLAARVAQMTPSDA